MKKTKHDFVKAIAGRLKGGLGRQELGERVLCDRVLEDVRHIDNRGRRYREAQYKAVYDELKAVLGEQEPLFRRADIAFSGLLMDTETQYLALGVALGCLLAGERPK